MTVPLFAHRLDPVGPYKLALELGRAAAREMLSDAVARSVLMQAAVAAAPDHPSLTSFYGRLTWAMRDAARDHVLARAAAERRIRNAVWPLCKCRASGMAIIAEAYRAGGDVLRRHEQLALCRTVAMQAQGGPRGGR